MRGRLKSEIVLQAVNQSRQMKTQSEDGEPINKRSSRRFRRYRESRGWQIWGKPTIEARARNSSREGQTGQHDLHLVALQLALSAALEQVHNVNTTGGNTGEIHSDTYHIYQIVSKYDCLCFGRCLFVSLKAPADLEQYSA
jgi:hypothetical protein